MTAWQPVALAADIEPGTSAGTRLDGRELVVWRDEAGQSHVWEDWCPHRGMRLSFGFVRGDRIACLYHGWQFGAGGACRHIPSHPALKVPGTIRASVLPSAERLGIIWVNAAGDGPADTAVAPVRSLAVHAPPARVLAALIAPQDSPFADGAPVLAEQTGSLVTLRAGGRQIAAALQPLSSLETTLHLTILGAPAADCGAMQRHVSAWAEALRRAVEQAP